MPYPRWAFFPRNERAPGWVDELIAVVARHRASISTLEGLRLDSNTVLVQLAEDLAALGYQVEKSKNASDKISRPVLFGDEGKAAVRMEIDAFHDDNAVAVEVGAGRAWNGNAVYRNLVRASLLLDADFLVLILPLAYSPPSARVPVAAYDYSRDLVDAIYASRRLTLPFDGLLLIGY